MKIEYFKIATLMILYYLLVYIISYFSENEDSNNTLANLLFLIIEISIPFCLFYYFFKQKISHVKSLYFSCLLAVSLCALSHLFVKIFIYQYIDPKRSSIIADRIASGVVARMESIERENNIKIDTDKSKEYKKIYDRIKAKYEVNGILKSAFVDIFIYSIISALFVYFTKRKMLVFSKKSPD
ncbi:DUF4199 family protein [Aquirufa ecclesiirivi]|uniref:DUF4199 family protein n=1 Tax=Aquirufa ecclesiirivi TaxID=2715124 RepID=UPI00140AC6A3|nr:DUF4199 family protein [Aquirufa ecclesiirivi]MDF0692930.1 DUF4199 family protein [Aquirufa ecclesiirivi]NHC47704.1 DUF4199 family protein [Aquirufa ecclesiirivi]